MITDITNKDPNIFLDKELEIRRENNLPPFQRFIALIITGNNERELEKESFRFKNFIEKSVKGKVLGPVNAPIYRLKRKFRVRLLVRGQKSLKVQNSLSKIISKFKFSSGMKLTVDVDPINFN
jgi:primosomal protein N' (replication factor Y) (superfamily II helicase)